MNNIDCIILTFGPVTSTSTLITPGNRARSSLVDEILSGKWSSLTDSAAFMAYRRLPTAASRADHLLFWNRPLSYN
jgi:hypothetical protein